MNLTTANDAPSISAHHLCVSFDDISVLSDINLDFYSGKTSAILGANGSGKTTLIRALLGLLPIHEGSVEIHAFQKAQLDLLPRVAA